jgi:hypothetical protein
MGSGCGPADCAKAELVKAKTDRKTARLLKQIFEEAG